ncbi:hypothetical protein [Mesorhizobium sp. ANAO-SY3R2]|uniref:hypothetical protein n=1 Tax=Mesorhizobium sp. ANAO-SY3R2 TaxID=3166644 RepID=UPI00366FD3BF
MNFGWNDVAEAIQQLVRSQERDFSPDTIRNAEDFIMHARERLMPPDHIVPGYWATFELGWDCSPAISVEIFDDRYEFYRMREGKTDIFEFAHRPGEPFSGNLDELLALACAQVPKAD